MCVLVIVVQCLHLIVCLSIPFSTFHFMTVKNVLALHFFIVLLSFSLVSATISTINSV